jgi:hypothetical protein
MTLLLLACAYEILLIVIIIVYILYSNMWRSVLLDVVLQNILILIQIYFNLLHHVNLGK